jgi:hypothetical protein
VVNNIFKSIRCGYAATSSAARNLPLNEILPAARGREDFWILTFRNCMLYFAQAHDSPRSPEGVEVSFASSGLSLRF